MQAQQSGKNQVFWMAIGDEEFFNQNGGFYWHHLSQMSQSWQQMLQQAGGNV